MKMKPATLVLIFIIALSGCQGTRQMIFGINKIECKNDEYGNVVERKKTNRRTTSLISHPHNSIIERTRIKKYINKRLVESIFYKKKFTMSDWDGIQLKYKKITLREDGKKIKSKKK